ncbi:MAG: hypothetical protein DSY58_06840 [Desulfobulbus sp.]|nr:MAG: hypothetical protein DSY58_06840 [Desulfobulbus sp.]RUM39852.1 MAG: hypothetical protein DSY70_04805 [Desulfobulbus sp.]
MADPLEHEVLKALKSGTGKDTILKNLATPDNKDDLIWYLNNFPTGKGRLENKWINWLLVILLLAVTVNKLYFIALLQLKAISANMFSPMLLLDLIVPAINFFILSKIIRFHRQGYQFMVVLGTLGLIRPENRVMPNLAFYLVIIGLTIFLLLRLFPKQDTLKD